VVKDDLGGKDAATSSRFFASLFILNNQSEISAGFLTQKAQINFLLSSRMATIRKMMLANQTATWAGIVSERPIPSLAR
jgi:hypothetical protein